MTLGLKSANKHVSEKKEHQSDEKKPQETKKLLVVENLNILTDLMHIPYKYPKYSEAIGKKQ